MSRIGREPVVIPAGVTVTVADGNLVTVKGKNGELSYKFPAVLSIENNAGIVKVSRSDDEAQTRALHGTCRALISDMVIGVSQGYQKKLEIVGVGYRAQKSGKTLTLNLGHSHPIIYEDGDGVSYETPDSNTILVKGADKQKVGQMAAEIRSKRPPEPYLGKGVKYEGEHIRRKAGKTGK